jgi:small-conductance mechanosensitive channel
MQPSEALSASAQVAVTLAGFAGVVVAFRSGSIHEWPKIDKFRLEILLGNSALPFILSIFGMVMVATSLSQPTIWRWCSLSAFIITVARGRALSQAYRAFSREELKASGSRKWIFNSAAWAGIAATLLQLYNVIRLQTFWPFFAMIATWLCLAMVQFILLVTAPHEQTHSS